MRSKQMSPHQRSIGVAVEDLDNLRHARTAVNMCDAKSLLVFRLLPNIRHYRSVVLTEQFHARLQPNNAITLSANKWLWSAKRA
jgi:hypothetical protein